jgi:hypothetical protein
VARFGSIDRVLDRVDLIDLGAGGPKRDARLPMTVLHHKNRMNDS